MKKLLMQAILILLMVGFGNGYHLHHYASTSKLRRIQSFARLKVGRTSLGSQYRNVGRTPLNNIPKLYAHPANQIIASTDPFASVSINTKAILWLTLFVTSAMLYSAEAAIMKLSSWKIQEFVDEEGPHSPFSILSTNRSALVCSILIATTAISIYSTGLFMNVMSTRWPDLGLAWITAFLTVFTLVFGELLPKSFALANAELFSRKTIPLIAPLSRLLSPVTSLFLSVSDRFIDHLNMRSQNDTNVSEDMLRLVVNEAQKTEGIQNDEGRMITAVLDLQNTEVSKIMKPRIEIVALSKDSNMTTMLETAVQYRYSRLPIFDADVDNIVGMVLCKDILAHLSNCSTAAASVSPATPASIFESRYNWGSITAEQLMEPIIFIPQTMTLWTAMQEMKKRRLHMAVVVDEYGGTAGLVTFEDILEEVVGEIYDEDEDEELEQNSNIIFLDKASGVMLIKGCANLDDVCSALDWELEEEERGGECSTLGGLLCAHVRKIPKTGDIVTIQPFAFTVLEVTDNRRIESVKVTRLTGVEAGLDSDVPIVDSAEGVSPVRGT